MATSKDIRIAIQWHIRDEWYGTNKRYILDYAFTTKKAAKVFEKALKQYVYEGHITSYNSLKKSSFKTICDTRDSESLKTYKYSSLGPGWSCDERVVSVEEIEEFAKRKGIKIF